jgi:hypothetical protein
VRLEQLYKNFGSSSVEDQTAYIVEYRLKRAKDLETIPKSKPSTTSKKISYELTDEEKALMKLLGIKKRDLEALRSATSNGDAEETGTSEDLFKDDTFGGDEDG